MDKRPPDKCCVLPVTILPDCRRISYGYDASRDWVNDTAGYWLIRILPGPGLIEAGFCRARNEVEVLFSGRKPQDIYFEAARLGLLGRADHYAYLGSELQKAYIALRRGIPYVQDEELPI